MASLFRRCYGCINLNVSICIFQGIFENFKLEKNLFSNMTSTTYYISDLQFRFSGSFILIAATYSITGLNKIWNQNSYHNFDHLLIQKIIITFTVLWKVSDIHNYTRIPSNTSPKYTRKCESQRSGQTYMIKELCSPFRV